MCWGVGIELTWSKKIEMGKLNIVLNVLNLITSQEK